MTPPSFAVDRMLGRLAKWLRILGFNTTYGANLSGRAIIRHARTEKRILLTSERRTMRALNLPPLLQLRSGDVSEQLLDVVKEFELRSQIALFTRCTHCNAELTVRTLADVVDAIPPYIAQTQTRFSRCPGCKRVYWAGTHEQRIRRELERIALLCPIAPSTP